MLQACPCSNIKAKPHISSRLTIWKKNHGSLSQMLSRSGFWWNDSSYTLNVQSDDVWNNYVKLKTDNSARTVRHKSWPLYKDWCEIFGKDRATGANVEAFVDVAEELNNADLGKEKEIGGDYVPIFQDSPSHDEAQSMFVCRGGSSASQKSKSSRKKKIIDDDYDSFMPTFAAFSDKFDARL
ncbi:hypothetical protein BUALT_Bualt05G0113900 [Buddleja alternifolia]|uniref:Myb/SANT-like domain-containing protein n=1 Tax=Buddleja alternifolia TaxID=168488 RepID=A0AAV6XMS6_9LAMI|nr:hypothetical protein BUALT_Bualt05G0113900 [Buddleja alternifolia]